MIGDYIPLSFKSLSKNELNYLDLLNNGIDELIQLSIKSLKTKEIQDLFHIKDGDEFKEEFKKTNLYFDLNKSMKDNSIKSIPPLKKFYKIGSKLGYESINIRTRDWNTYDEEAFSILSDYVEDLVLNLNQSVGIGIRNTLYDSNINDFPISEIGLNLLKVPTMVVDRFQINTHSTMIATTEYGRAVNTGTLQSFSNSGVKDVNIVTTGLPNVCEICIEIESKNPYTIEEAMKLLPVHSRCACSIMSANSLNTGYTGNPIIVDLTT